MERDKRVFHNNLIKASKAYSLELLDKRNQATQRFLSVAREYKAAREFADQELTPLEVARAQMLGAMWAGDKMNARQQKWWLEELSRSDFPQDFPIKSTPILLHRFRL